MKGLVTHAYGAIVELKYMMRDDDERLLHHLMMPLQHLKQLSNNCYVCNHGLT